jgi:hypothetical protein
MKSSIITIKGTTKGHMKIYIKVHLNYKCPKRKKSQIYFRSTPMKFGLSWIPNHLKLKVNDILYNCEFNIIQMRFPV